MKLTLNVVDLTFGYSSTPVLQNVTLPAVCAAEVTAVFGPNANAERTAWCGREWVKLLIYGRLLRSVHPTRSFKVLSYPSGMTVSSRALGVLSDALRAHRNQRAPRWRKLTAGGQALLVVAYLRKGETYADLPAASKWASRRSTAISARPSPAGGHGADAGAGEGLASRKAFVILDGTLLRIDRVGMAWGYDRAFYSGKHKAHGLNVQEVIADPIGRLVWISPPLPGARHDMGAAREHGIIDALTAYEIPAAADTAYQGAGPTVSVPQRRRRLDTDTGRYSKLSLEDRQGGRVLLDGAVIHEDGILDDVVDVRHDLRFDALDLKSGTVEVTTKRGTLYMVEADASAGGGLMSGGGYGGQHGRPMGRDFLEHDVYPLDGSVTQLTLGSALTDRLAA